MSILREIDLSASADSARHPSVHKRAMQEAGRTAKARGYRLVGGWRLKGAHDQCREVSLLNSVGIPCGYCSAFPSGLWQVVVYRKIIAEGQIEP